MTADEAYKLYLVANAEEKAAWAVYLKACANTRKASALHDNAVFAERLRIPPPKPEAPGGTALSAVTDSLGEKG